ncbi:hypothetical protein BKA93DRAFT_753066 [Sparassis latifolia]
MIRMHSREVMIENRRTIHEVEEGQRTNKQRSSIPSNPRDPKYHLKHCLAYRNRAHVHPAEIGRLLHITTPDRRKKGRKITDYPTKRHTSRKGDTAATVMMNHNPSYTDGETPLQTNCLRCYCPAQAHIAQKTVRESSAPTMDSRPWLAALSEHIEGAPPCSVSASSGLARTRKRGQPAPGRVTQNTDGADSKGSTRSWAVGAVHSYDVSQAPPVRPQRRVSGHGEGRGRLLVHRSTVAAGPARPARECGRRRDDPLCGTSIAAASLLLESKMKVKIWGNDGVGTIASTW